MVHVPNGVRPHMETRICTYKLVALIERNTQKLETVAKFMVVKFVKTQAQACYHNSGMFY